METLIKNVIRIINQKTISESGKYYEQNKIEWCGKIPCLGGLWIYLYLSGWKNFFEKVTFKQNLEDKEKPPYKLLKEDSSESWTLLWKQCGLFWKDGKAGAATICGWEGRSGSNSEEWREGPRQPPHVGLAGKKVGVSWSAYKTSEKFLKGKSWLIYILYIFRTHLGCCVKNGSRAAGVAAGDPFPDHRSTQAGGRRAWRLKQSRREWIQQFLKKMPMG